MSKTKNTLFSIYGMEIREDSLYEVREKLDTNAPDGFQNEHTTKLLNENVIDIEPVGAWDNSLGSWDTGLSVKSIKVRYIIPSTLTDTYQTYNMTL